MSDNQPVIGIDLGTTNSLVAVFEESGPRLIPNAIGEVLTPSVVGFNDDGAIVVGEAAKNRLMTHPKQTAARFKRLMGTDKETLLGKKSFRAEELSALVLQSLKQDAEADLGQPVKDAVISVPAYFNDKQRQATKSAAILAGLNVRRLINEPTAASLAYGIEDRTAETRLLVIDLGGGTFDVSILEMFSGVMEVRASSGDAFLGGEDFTDALVEDLKAQTKLKKFDEADMGRLRALADRMKHSLSENPAVQMEFVHNKKAYPVSITREAFEELNAETLKKLRLPIQRVIMDAELRSDDLDRIILVGGATRMPSIRSLVTRLFKRFPEHDIDPDHVVGLGAAVQAGLTNRHEALEDVVMTDVSPFTLGYETSIEVGNRQYESGHFSPLIERNTVVPVSRSNVAQAMEKGQTKINLNIYQGESPYVRDNVQIGKLEVDIPRNLKEHEAIEVRYTYDTSGVLEVIATTLSTGIKRRLVIEGNPGTMSKAEIEKRLKELDKIKVHPRDEAENEAFIAQLKAAYENALGERRQYIQNLIQQFEAALHKQDPRHITEVRGILEKELSYLDNDNVF